MKNKNNFKKSISFFMAFIIGLCNLSFPTEIFASTTVDDKNVTLIMKQEGTNIFGYNGAVHDDFKGDYIVDQESGLPAYCINPTKAGVPKAPSVFVDIDGNKMLDTDDITNQRVYNALMAGFPFKTSAELGVSTELEAYNATKFAIWSILDEGGYSIDGWQLVSGSQNAMDALHNIYNAGMSGTSRNSKPSIVAVPSTSEALRIGATDRFIQIFTLQSDSEIYNYTVSVPGPAIVTDTNGNPKTTFSAGEQFGIVSNENDIPLEPETRTYDLTIKANVDAMKSKLVLYAQPVGNYQTYTYMSASSPQSTTGKATFSRAAEPRVESGDLTIYKYENGTTIPLEGAKFEFRQLNSEISNIYTTNSNGQIVINDITNGDYVLTEVQAPKNYVIDYDFPLNVKIDSTTYPNGQEITIHNKKITGMQIYKVDGKTGKPLANATFEIASKDGSEKTTVTTGADGKADFQPPYIGWYTIKEVVAPEGYILNEEHQDVYIDGIQDVVLTFKNYEKTTVKITKHDLADGKLLPNAEFSIMNKDTGEIVYEGLTDENGEIIITDLEAGNYIITELAPPENYIKVTDSREIKVGEGQDVTVKFDNKLKPSLEINKIDGESKEPLANTTFKVEKLDGSFSSEFTTDSNGKILLEHIDEGVYKVTEIVAPSGYVLSSEPKTIDLKWQSDNSFVYSLIFENYTKPSLIVEKYDEMTNELLPNAQFKIEGLNNNFLWEGVLSSGNITDGATQIISGSLEDGRIVLNGLPEGTYKVTEINPPNGYTYSDTTENPRTVVVTANNTTTVKIDNRPLPDLEILKIDSITNEPIENVTFEIRKTDGEFAVECQTDENGKINLTDIDEGIYTITEVKAPNNYILDENNVKTISIKWNGGDNKDGNYELIFENTLKPTLVISKLSGLSGLGLSGARFTIEYRSNDGSYKTIGTYSTNANGQIILSNMYVGWYRVTEINPPAGYQLPSNPTYETYLDPGQNSYEPIYKPEISDNTNGDIVVSNGGDLSVTYGMDITEISTLFNSNTTVYNSDLPIINYPLNSIAIKKIDAQTGELLEGATFDLIKVTEELSGTGGTTIGTYTTDKSGIIVVTGLNSGAYIVKEVKPPTNYDIDITNQQQAWLKQDGTSIIELTFNNYRYGSLVINKMDSNTKEPLANATFKVTNALGEMIGTGNGQFITDETGTITIDGLKPDSYIVTEVSAPKNYILDTNTQVLEIGYGETKELDFFNKAKSGIKIIKLDKVTNEPLPNATFTVKNKNGNLIGEYTTDNDGIVLIENLDPSWYVITEISAPTGYLIDTGSKEVEVTWGELTEVRMYNNPISSLTIKKLDSVTRQPLQYAKFEVTKQDGTYIGSYESDINGVIFIESIEPGYYIIKETLAPSGYLLDTSSQTVEVKVSEAKVLTFYNKPKSGMQIIKIDADTKAPLKDAHFTIYHKNGQVVGNYITDKDGLIIIDNLEPGWYKAAETKSPDGYLLDDIPKDFEVTNNEFIKLVFENHKLTSLQIKKVDEITGEPLVGANFTVTTQTGTLVGEYTTGEDGFINVPTLEPNWYTVTETKAPENYLIDNTPKTVEVKSGSPTIVTFTNKKLETLQIKKVDEETNEPLSNANFTVTTLEGAKIGDYTTGTDGFINIPNIKPDWYIITETKAPDNYILDSTPRNVEVKSGIPTSVTFTNKPLSGLTIVKLDSDTRKVLQGAKFTISKLDGETILNEVSSSTFITDETGKINIPNLADGYYVITELEAPQGYILNTETTTVKIESGKTTTVEILNKPYSGLVIYKTDSKTGKPLAGVTYDIKKANGERVTGNILDQNQFDTENNSPNKNISVNGSVTGSFITDKNGRILLNNLQAGEYHVVETKALDGYVLDETIHSVTVVPGKQAILNLTNEPLAGLRIKKIDSVTKLAIYGVEFRIYDFETKKEVGGPYYTDNNGVIDFFGILEAGRYTIKETEPAPNYIRDDIPKTIEFKEGTYTEIVWENQPLMGQVQITKKSASDNYTNGLPAGTPLADAVFEVYDYKTGNVVDQFTTKSNGIGVSRPLPLGRYTIKEIQAPMYYKVSDKELDVTIEFSSQILKYEFTNEPSNLGVTIKKVAPYEVVNGQEIKYDIKTVQNNSTVPLTDFYFRDVVPQEIVLTKIVTGTYNQGGTYKIMFKTNKNDYRVAYDNLSTTNNNVVDMSPAALGVFADERITEVMFIFGNVKAGFTQVETPAIYGKVNSNLPNGYQFANKVDIGGKYQGEWVIGNSTWVTTIYNPSEPSLPRTGY